MAKKKVRKSAALRKGSQAPRGRNAQKVSGSKARRDAPSRRKAAEMCAAQFADLLTGIRSLHERLDAFQAELDDVRSLAGATRAGTKGSTTAAADDDAMVALTFEKTTGPDNVRVTLEGEDKPVLLPFMKKGKSKPRSVGSSVTAKVEVNAGATVLIDVSHASPSQLHGRGSFPLTVLE